MSAEIVFYHNRQSRAQMAHWMLEEAGAPYKTVLIDFAKGENRTPQFLAINPMGKLPTMMLGASGLKGEKVFDDYVGRLSAHPAAQRAAGG